MQDNTKELMDNFRKATKGLYEQNKERSIVKLLTKTVKSLESVLAAMDKFLKGKGVDVGKAYDATKEKGKSLLEKGKGVLTETKENGIKATGLNILGKVKDKYKGFIDNNTGPPQEDPNKPPQENSETPADPNQPEEKKPLTFKGLYNKAKRKVASSLVKTTDYVKGKIDENQPEAELYEVKFNQAIDIARNKALDIKDKLVAFYEDSKEEGTRILEEAKAKKKDKKKPSVTDKLGTLLDTMMSKLKPKKEEGETKTSWFTKAKNRADKKSKEVEAEKEAVKNGAKKKPNSWLGKIISGISMLGGFVVKGISTVLGLGFKGLTKSIGFLGGFLFKGFSKSLFKIVPMLSGGIASTLGTLLKGGLKGAAGLAWDGIKAVGTKILPFAGQAAAALGRGALMLATGPVGWAIAAGTAVYAGYKLYKYLTRNDISDDIYGKLTRLRLNLYGFNNNNKDYYSKLFDLEMLMKDNIKFVNYQVVFKPLDKDTIEKVLDIFSVDRKDKANYDIINVWFMKRFIPAYKAYVSSLYSINNAIYLDDLDKLNIGEVETFINKLKIPLSIYDVTNIPVSGNKVTTVTKDEIENVIIAIKNEILKKSKDNGKPKTDTPVAPVPVKPPVSTRGGSTPIAKQQSAAAATAAVIAPAAAPLKDSSTYAKTNNTDSEDGAKPKETPVKPQAQDLPAKVQGKLTTAQGELSPGTKDLTGISTKLKREKIDNLDPKVNELFTGMAKEYNTLTGKNIQVNEAFRSYEDQAALYKKMPGKAAKPGGSTHEAGLAIDVNSADVKTLDDKGLLRKYGFTTAVGGEGWHLEPIGVSMNPTMAKKDLNFREKAIEASPGRGGGGYGLASGSVMKKRNIPLQTSIFNSAAQTVIDPSKDKKDLPPQSSIASIDKAKPETTADTQVTKYNSETGKAASATEPAIGTQVTKYNSESSKPTSTREVTTSMSEDGAKPKETTVTYNDKNPIKAKEQSPSLTTPSEAVPSTNANLDVSKYAKLDTMQAIKQAAKVTGASESTLINFAKLESSLNPNAKAKTSSATGLFQIIDGTWSALVKKYGAKYGIDQNSDRTNPYYNAVMGAEYLKENLRGLKGYKEAGVEEDTALYMAHFLGLAGSNKFFANLNKNPKAPIETAVDPKTITANASLMKGKTLEGMIDAVDAKLDKASDSSSNFKQQTAKKENNAPVRDSKASVAVATNATTTKSNTTSVAQAAPATNQTSAETFEETSTPNSNPTIAQSNINNNLGIKPTKVSYNEESYKTQPTISTSRLDLNSSTQFSNMRVTPPTTTEPSSAMQGFSTTGMENILSDQLSTLTQIATILTGMSSKFDITKLTDAIKSKKPEQDSKPTLPEARESNKREVRGYDKQTSVVNLSRRTITA